MTMIEHEECRLVTLGTLAYVRRLEQMRAKVASVKDKVKRHNLRRRILAAHATLARAGLA